MKSKNRKIKNSKVFLMPIFIGALFLGLISFILPKFVNKNVTKDKIKSINLSEDCVVTIDLKSGKTELIDIKSDVISKECNVTPIVSKDGKYAAFDLNLVIKDTETKMGKSANNSSILYISDLNKWISAYNHGAGEATSISFDENNNLIVNIRYENKDLEPRVVKNSDFGQKIEDEEAMALGLVKREKDVVNWLKNFDSKSYLSANKESKAVVQIDRYEGDSIIINVSEQFLTDGHRATFNWYKYNRLSFTVTKEFEY